MFRSPFIDPVLRYQMEQRNFPQTIQTLQPQVQCYSVTSSSDISNIPVMPGVVYAGFNVNGNEIYLRQMNNDGNIDFKTFVLSSGVQEQSDLKAISAALDEIKEFIKGGKNESNVTAIGATVNVGNRTEQPDGRSLQQNDGWQDSQRPV